MAVAHGLGQLREGWGADGAATIWDTTNKIILPGVTDSDCLDAMSDICGTVGATEGERRVQVPAVPPAFVRRLPRRRALILEGDLAPVVVKTRPVWARLAARLRLRSPRRSWTRHPGRAGRSGGTGSRHRGWDLPAPDHRPAGRSAPPGRPGRPGRRTRPRDRHTGPTPEEPEDPEAEARRLQEELERARRAGSATPYETLAALAAGLVRPARRRSATWTPWWTAPAWSWRKTSGSASAA